MYIGKKWALYMKGWHGESFAIFYFWLQHFFRLEDSDFDP